MVLQFCGTEMKNGLLLQTVFQKICGVTDGARTHDNRNHNPGLYQLSYGHHRETKF